MFAFETPAFGRGFPEYTFDVNADLEGRSAKFLATILSAPDVYTERSWFNKSAFTPLQTLTGKRDINK